MPRKRKVDNEEVKFLKDGLPHYEKEIEALKRELEEANKEIFRLKFLYFIIIFIFCFKCYTI